MQQQEKPYKKSKRSKKEKVSKKDRARDRTPEPQQQAEEEEEEEEDLMPRLVTALENLGKARFPEVTAKPRPAEPSTVQAKKKSWPKWCRNC